MTFTASAEMIPFQDLKTGEGIYTLYDEYADYDALSPYSLFRLIEAHQFSTDSLMSYPSRKYALAKEAASSFDNDFKKATLMVKKLPALFDSALFSILTAKEQEDGSVVVYGSYDWFDAPQKKLMNHPAWWAPLPETLAYLDSMGSRFSMRDVLRIVNHVESYKRAKRYFPQP